MLDISEQKTKLTNITNNTNNILADEDKLLEEKHQLLEEKHQLLEAKNQLLITLMNYEKNEWQKKAVVEVNEKMVEQYESEIFELNEKKCKLEQQLSINSDEGFNSITTSTESLPASDLSLPSKKQTKLQITKTNEQEKSAKPWEQTLRQYDYPTSYQQKIKTNNKSKPIKI